MQGEPSQRAGGPIVGDAFGRLLLDCFEANLEPGRFAQIIERDDGFVEAGDPSIYFQGEPLSEQEALAISQAKGRVLDIGAGAGRHSLRLQARGLDVVALDVSPLAVEVCKRRGVQRVFTGSIEELAATNAAPFDTFLLAGGNLGLLRDRQYASSFLEALGAMAGPGAVIIGSGIDPYGTDSKDHLEYHAANRAAGRMAGQVTIRVRHRRWATEWFGLLWTSIRAGDAAAEHGLGVGGRDRGGKGVLRPASKAVGGAGEGRRLEREPTICYHPPGASINVTGRSTLPDMTLLLQG